MKFSSSLSLEYDDQQMENLESLRDNFSLINEDIAIFILSDESTNLSNLFSWNIEKYLRLIRSNVGVINSKKNPNPKEGLVY